MIERIKLLLQASNMNASKFADEIGVQRSSISHILSGRNLPSLDLIQKILKRFPDVSTEWILNGKGSMLKNQTELFVENEDDTLLFPSNEDIKKSSTDNFNNQIENNEIITEKPENKGTSEVFLSTKAPENSINQNEPDIVEENLKEKQLKSNSRTSRKIEKIVIFYTDNTFKEYFPEN